MKTGIHPNFTQQATITCACGAKYTTGSTKESVFVELCKACHPFYTGKQKIVDTARRLEKFKAKEDLDIYLLSDEDHSVQEEYGVWQKKKFMGREYMGTVRTTFVIDERGYVRKVWENVKAKGHAKEVLKSLDGINS